MGSQTPGEGFGQNGNYLSELKAQPGGPEGRPHTTAGSKPIRKTGRPQVVRPRSLNSDQCAIPDLRKIRRQQPVPSPVSISRTYSQPWVQRSGTAELPGRKQLSWFNHARYDCVNRLVAAYETSGAGTYTEGCNSTVSIPGTTAWQQRYLYDAFGNRAVTGSLVVPNLTPQPTNTGQVPYL